jgi:hypothetical protein
MNPPQKDEIWRTGASPWKPLEFGVRCIRNAPRAKRPAAARRLLEELLQHCPKDGEACVALRELAKALLPLVDPPENRAEAALRQLANVLADLLPE